MTPTLGQPVTFTHSLHRRSGWGEDFGIRRGHRKLWEAEPVLHLVFGAAELSGVIVGVRTLSNGRVTYGYGEDGDMVYRPDKDGHFTVYLVAYDLRRKPVHVLPGHATLEDQ